jgi:hypothetical protein
MTVRVKNCRLLFIIFLIAFVVIFLWLIVKWLGSPAKGTFKTLVKEPDPSKTLNIEPKKLDSKFFMVKYPDDYTVKVKEASDSGMLEKIILLGAGMSSKKLLISSDKTQETDLANISAVQYRRLKPTLYLEKTVILDDRNGLLYERRDGSYEKTAFFLRDGIVTVISLTAPLVNKDFDKDYTYIFDNFFWK